MTKPLGLSAAQLDLIEKILQDILISKRHVTVSVFGSRARGDHRQYSDLDLWIESKPELLRNEEAELRSRFEESDLPIKIDIVTPESCLDIYKTQILSEKKIWFQLGI